MSNLAEAFASHASIEKGSDWCCKYRATLLAVEKAAQTPDRVSEDLVKRLLFDSHNGICDIDQGGIVYQIKGYNKRFPDHVKPMPEKTDFMPLVSAMLKRRNEGVPLTAKEYKCFRRQFTDIVHMNLYAVFNRLVVALFPDQFVTPCDDVRIVKFQNVLIAKHFIRQKMPSSGATSWFERSEHIAKELRFGLASNPDLDAATCSSFVWSEGIIK